MRLSVQRPGALVLMAALAFVLRGREAHAQDSSTTVRITLQYAPGTKPGVLVLPIRGVNGDSVRAILVFLDLLKADPALFGQRFLRHTDRSPTDAHGSSKRDVHRVWCLVGRLGHHRLLLRPIQTPPRPDHLGIQGS